MPQQQQQGLQPPRRKRQRSGSGPAQNPEEDEQLANYAVAFYSEKNQEAEAKQGQQGQERKGPAQEAEGPAQEDATLLLALQPTINKIELQHRRKIRKLYHKLYSLRLTAQKLKSAT